MVKRLAVMVLALSLALGGMSAARVQAQSIRVVIDGQLVVFDQPPAAIGGRVLVPLRGVFERLGAFVQWDPRTNTVTAIRADTQVQLVIGSRQATVNGRVVALDVPALIVAGRTLVPLRFVSEAMGARVDWDASARTVFITSAPVAQPVPPPEPRPTPVPPPQATVVEGTVFRVDVQGTPQRILVQRENLIHTFIVTPDTAITRIEVDTNRGGAISLDQVRVGDFVRVTVDPSGRAILIRVTVREVVGRIDTLTSRVIVLSDGQTFALDDDVRFLMDGRVVPRDQVRAGMEVTLRINPQTQRVTEVAVRGVVVAPTPPPTAIRIASFTHNAQGPLRAGETLTVSLRGTPGGVATFDIFGVAADVPLREVSPGVYQGAYVVRIGDNVANAAIFGHLRVGGQEAPIVQAGTPVTIDTLAPVITQRFPEANTTTNNARPNILVTFTDRGGSGINTAATRLFVNEQDVTARATVTETVVAYNPPEPLTGAVIVRLVLTDRAGNRTDDRYAFTISAVQGSLIRSVTVHPTTPLRTGDTLNVTMVGEPGGQASFTIEGIAQNISMVEAGNQPGVYFGAYTVRAGDNAQNARIIVQLTRGGVTSRADASARLMIVTAEVPPPVITSPAPGTRVGAPIVIRGRATPGHQVVVRVDYRGTVLVFGLQGTYGEVTSTADAAGNWQVTINQSIRVADAELTIIARAIDPAGRRSEPTIIKVSQG